MFDDGHLPPELRTHRFAAWCERQPWGQHFPEPTFTQNFKVLRVQPLGTEHQRLVLMDADEHPLIIKGDPEKASNRPPVYGTASGAESINMVWFFSRNQREPKIVLSDTLANHPSLEHHHYHQYVQDDGTLEPGTTVQVAYQSVINRFRGANSLQGIIRKVCVLGGSH